MLNHKKEDKYEVKEQGTSYVGTTKDLKELTGDGGFVLTKNVRLSKAKSYEHVVVIGPTGCGKSSSFIIPNVLDLDGKTSVVVSDPKGEIHDTCKPYLESMGYNVMKIDPFQSIIRYNPLLIAADNTELKEIAQLVMINGNKSYEAATGGSSGGAEWLSMSEPLLVASFMYVRAKGLKKDIPEAMKIILYKDINELDAIFKEYPPAYQEFMMFAQSKESTKTMSSIKVTLANALKLFNDEKIRQFVETPFKKKVINGKECFVPQFNLLFHPKILREKPTALFVCVPERKALFAMPLMSVFYSQLLNKTMDYAVGNDYVPVLFLLDEFANIGTLPGFAALVATARSRKLGVAIALQGMEQLKANYGEETAYNILNNMKTKLFYAGLTGTSAEYVSQLAGYTTIKAESVTTNDNGSSSSISDQRRELITADEVRRIDENKMIIIAHNKPVVFDERNNWYLQDKYLKKVPGSK
ncbi:MAG: type IV secretory system conjugative DNA transfer family protein [Clostridia bacterium]|nr:type IV secretory system conjugative DNA transfer family protein [Clostridia bacterium]